jgi:hypothetical protein
MLICTTKNRHNACLLPHCCCPPSQEHLPRPPHPWSPLLSVHPLQSQDSRDQSHLSTLRHLPAPHLRPCPRSSPHPPLHHLRLSRNHPHPNPHLARPPHHLLPHHPHHQSTSQAGRAQAHLASWLYTTATELPTIPRPLHGAHSWPRGPRAGPITWHRSSTVRLPPHNRCGSIFHQACDRAACRVAISGPKQQHIQCLANRSSYCIEPADDHPWGLTWLHAAIHWLCVGIQGQVW